jgi:hypothetical protein
VPETIPIGILGSAASKSHPIGASAVVFLVLRNSVFSDGSPVTDNHGTESVLDCNLTVLPL